MFTQRKTLFVPETRNTRYVWKRTKQQSGSGIQNTKLSKVVLERAFGPEVMKAIASVKASDVAGAAQEGSAYATDASRSALNALIGNETTGGALQVTTTGRGRGVTDY